MNKKDYDIFLKYLEDEDKDKALTFILDRFESGQKVKDVYESFLIPSLANFECFESEDICIWKEHVRTSIIRTILESSYKYIIRDRLENNKIKILTVCPQEEYHEIGAIIANHYFNLVGFQSIYVGANTPNDNIVSAIKAIRPDYVAISVTNYYNLVVTKKLTNMIHSEFPNIKIIIGGQAFSHQGALGQVDYDFMLGTYEDIKKFRDEVAK